MTAMEIACRHSCGGYNCGAEAGDPCDWSHCHLEPGVTPPECHAERIEDASAISEPTTAPTLAEFDLAAEKSDLF